MSYDYARSDTLALWKACGVKTIIYTNPGIPNSTDNDGADVTWNLVQNTYNSVLARTAIGTIISDSWGGYYFDPHASDAAAYVQSVVTSVYNYTYGYADPGIMPDVVFFDNWNDLQGMNAAPGDFSTYSDWTTYTLAALSNLNGYGATVVVNTLSVPQGWQNQVSGLAAAAISGGEYEGCYSTASGWTTTEDIELSTIANGKQFWCLANQSFTSTYTASSYAARMFVYASFVLTYQTKAAVLEEDVATASGFHVFPEELFVPLEPLVAAPGEVTALETAGVYVRQYGACYYRGALVGGCAIVVNPSSAAVAVNLTQYKHSVALSGSDVLDGGTLSTTGPAVSQIASGSAAILTP